MLCSPVQVPSAAVPCGFLRGIRCLDNDRHRCRGGLFAELRHEVDMIAVASPNLSIAELSLQDMNGLMPRSSTELSRHYRTYFGKTHL